MISGKGMAFLLQGLDAGQSAPVAVHRGAHGQAGEFGLHVCPGGLAVQHVAVQADDLGHVVQLGREPQQAHAHGLQFLVVRQQGLAAVGHGLDAVDGEERLAFPGLQHQAVLMVQAAEFAVVLVEVVVAGGEAA